LSTIGHYIKSKYLIVFAIQISAFDCQFVVVARLAGSRPNFDCQNVVGLVVAFKGSRAASSGLTTPYLSG